ncbi:MAG: PepSY domain-containing protein [Peptostreptococcaceae bacterium]|nr:PepSY domain-containing protein [Peptostreptococcaceae bacterium]
MKANKKKLMVATMATAMTFTMAAGSLMAFATPKRTADIGEAKARAIALRDAGLKENQVAFVRIRLDRENGRNEYDIEFYSNGVEYDYEIDARTGAIMEKDRDIENYQIPKKQVNKTTAPKAAPKAAPKQKSNGGVIGEARAKQIALQKAGLNASQVKFATVKLDRDDGRLEYDVEFYHGNKEYDFEIDATSGAIRSFDTDLENDIYVNRNVKNNRWDDDDDDDDDRWDDRDDDRWDDRDDDDDDGDDD